MSITDKITTAVKTNWVTEGLSEDEVKAAVEAGKSMAINLKTGRRESVMCEKVTAVAKT